LTKVARAVDATGRHTAHKRPVIGTLRRSVDHPETHGADDGTSRRPARQGPRAVIVVGLVMLYSVLKLHGILQHPEAMPRLLDFPLVDNGILSGCGPETVGGQV
jgi:hypothetical protein